VQATKFVFGLKALEMTAPHIPLSLLSKGVGQVSSFQTNTLIVGFRCWWTQ